MFIDCYELYICVKTNQKINDLLLIINDLLSFDAHISSPDSFTETMMMFVCVCSTSRLRHCSAFEAGSESDPWGPTVEGPSGGREEVHVSAVNLCSLGEKEARGNLSSAV